MFASYTTKRVPGRYVTRGASSLCQLLIQFSFLEASSFGLSLPRIVARLSLSRTRQNSSMRHHRALCPKDELQSSLLPKYATADQNMAKMKSTFW